MKDQNKDITTYIYRCKTRIYSEENCSRVYLLILIIPIFSRKLFQGVSTNILVIPIFSRELFQGVSTNILVIPIYSRKLFQGVSTNPYYTYIQKKTVPGCIY